MSIVGTHISDTNHTLEWRLDTETGTVWSESKRRSNEVREYEFSTTPICLPALVIGLAAGTTYSTKVQTSQTQQLIQGVITTPSGSLKQVVLDIDTVFKKRF